MIEYGVSELFQQLLGPASGKQKHGLGYEATLLLNYTLDLRRKLKLIDIILQNRGIDESKMFKRIHSLHDLRNVIMHWPFGEELDQSGISADYINADGKTSFQKPGTGTKSNLITYEELISRLVSFTKSWTNWWNPQLRSWSQAKIYEEL
jgi:hypothetical protein